MHGEGMVQRWAAGSQTESSVLQRVLASVQYISSVLQSNLSWDICIGLNLMASLQHNTFSLILYYNASWTGHLYWRHSLISIGNTIDCTTTQHLCITMQVERDICIGPPAAWGSTRRQNVPFSSTKYFTTNFLLLVLAFDILFVDLSVYWCIFLCISVFVVVWSC